MQCPQWLNETAKKYWHKLVKDVPEHTPANQELLALLCCCFADYRQASADNDPRTRKIMLDFILKYTKQLKLGKTAQHEDDVDEFGL
jgi:phage terminase small subunit